MSWITRPGYAERLDVLAARFNGLASRDTCAAYLTYEDWSRSAGRYYLLGMLLVIWIPKLGFGAVAALLALIGLMILVATFTQVYVTRSAARSALQKEFGFQSKELLRAMRRGPKAVTSLVNRNEVRGAA